MAQVAVVAAALFAAGALLAAFRRDASSLSTGGVVMIGAAALALAGVSRFAASGRDPLAGQAFAIVLALSALALAALAASLAERDTGGRAP